MILEGNERGFGAELAHHLLNPRDNDHVAVHAIDGFIADDLFGAFAESEAISQATQCQKNLFSLSLNPPPDEVATVEAFEAAIVAVEKKLGLVGQPRAIVFHEKLGRRHAHCVWSRIDAGQMKAIKLSHYKRKLGDVSRELYRLHEWDIPDGFKDKNAHDPQNYSRQEAGQAKRARIDPKNQKAMFQKCWERSDSRSAFAAALWDEGYILARGDRRGFVAVDTNSKIWSLSRWCGVKPKELRARLGSEDTLWSIEDAISAFKELQARPQKPRADRSSPDVQHRLKALVERQRRERSNLRAEQEVRRLARLETQQAQLPTGLKAAWMRITGQYQALIAKLAEDARSAEAFDRNEHQTLITRHLAERKELDRIQTQPDILAGLTLTFDEASHPDPRQKLVLPPDDIPFTNIQLTKNPSLILDHVSYKQARFDRADVLRELAKRIQDPVALREAADVAMQSSDLIRLNNNDTTDFTTKDYLAAENGLLACALSLTHRCGPAVQENTIAHAISQQNADMQKSFGGRLSDEQRAALQHILGSAQLSCVVGLAGSGKSTMLKTAQSAWEKQGIKVHGAALAGKAAEGLQNASGIASRTLASLEASWKNGYEPIAPGEVLVVDEAGMIGTRQLMRVATKIQNIGAKLVLVGDPDQLQPIEAGSPFRKLVEIHGASHLTEIHRQRADWQRSASRDLAAGRIREAVESYDQHGAVSRRYSYDTALAALVENYMTDVEMNGSDTSRLAFAHRRKDVYALNQAIRSAIRSSGNPLAETLLDTETGPRALSAGDRIVFTRNDKHIGAKNGMLGTVTKVSSNQISVELDRDDDKRCKVTFNPIHFRAYDHGYSVTIHKSQGATVDRSYVLASRTMDDSLTYVAMTRHRIEANLFINEADQPVWAESRTIMRSHRPQHRIRGPRR
ncbi:MAG: AAA family ATPase [Cognatishimia sp.]